MKLSDGSQGYLREGHQAAPAGHVWTPCQCSVFLPRCSQISRVTAVVRELPRYLSWGTGNRKAELCSRNTTNNAISRRNPMIPNCSDSGNVKEKTAKRVGKNNNDDHQIHNLANQDVELIEDLQLMSISYLKVQIRGNT